MFSDKEEARTFFDWGKRLWEGTRVTKDSRKD